MFTFIHPLYVENIQCVCARLGLCVCVKQTRHQSDYTAVADRQRAPFIRKSRLQFHLTRRIRMCSGFIVYVFCLCVFERESNSGDGEWKGELVKLI